MGAADHPSTSDTREDVARFAHGESIILREVLHGRTWSTHAMRVVHDTPDQLALYVALGSPHMVPIGRTGDYDRATDPSDVRFERRAWRQTNMLVLTRPGEPWSTRVFWDAESGEHRCWYVNLEKPWRRTSLGFDTMDDELDIIVHPDRRVEWKDEDMLQHWVQCGVYSPADAERITANGLRALADIERWDSPFCDGWESWQPPTDWSHPEIPDRWDVLDDARCTSQLGRAGA